MLNSIKMREKKYIEFSVIQNFRKQGPMNRS
jgi:hypothetical protein